MSTRNFFQVPLHTDYTVMGRTFGSLGELFSFHAEEASKVNVLLRGIDAEIADLESKAKGLQEEISKTYRSEAKQKYANVSKILRFRRQVYQPSVQS